MRGRPTKPTAIKRATGNPGRKRLPVEPEIERAPTTTPPPPVPMQKSGLVEWHRVYGPLERAGVLRATDLSNLALYCIAVGRASDASELLMAMERQQPDGRGLLVKTTSGTMENPLVGTVRRAGHDAIRLGAEFGLTPSSRARLGVKDAPVKTVLDKYLN